MAKPLGKNFLLKYESPAAPGTYLTIANMRSNSMSINNETIDVTDKDGMPWRKLIEGGIVSIDMQADGIISDAASQKVIRGWVFNGSIKNFQMVDSLGNILQGLFLCQSFEQAGEFDGEQTFSLKLASADTIVLTEMA